MYEHHLLNLLDPLPCPFCATQFNTGPPLFAHCREDHEEIAMIAEMTVACPSTQCSEKITVIEGKELEKHFKQSHSTLVCRLCGTFVSESKLLNKHILVKHVRTVKKEKDL